MIFYRDAEEENSIWVLYSKFLHKYHEELTMSNLSQLVILYLEERPDYYTQGS